MSVKKDFQKVNKFSVILMVVLFLIVPAVLIFPGKKDYNRQPSQSQSFKKEEKPEPVKVEKTYQSEIYPQLAFEYPESWSLYWERKETALTFQDELVQDNYYEISQDDNAKKFINETLTLRKNSLKLSISTGLETQTERNYFLESDYRCIENREFNKKISGDLARITTEYIYPNEEKEVFKYNYINGLVFEDNEKFEEYYSAAREDSNYGLIGGSRDNYFGCYLDYNAGEMGFVKTDYVYKGKNLYGFISVDLEIPKGVSQENLNEADKIVESLFANKQPVEDFKDAQPILPRNWTKLSGSGTYKNANLPDFSFDYDSNDWEVYVDEEVKDYDVLNVKLKDGDNVVKMWLSYMPYWESSPVCILDGEYYDSMNDNYSWIPWKEPGWLVLSDRKQWFFKGDHTFEIYYSSFCLDKADAIDKGMSILFSTKVYNRNLEDPSGMIDPNDLKKEFLDSRVIVLYQGEMTEEMQAKLDKFLNSLKF